MTSLNRRRFLAISASALALAGPGHSGSLRQSSGSGLGAHMTITLDHADGEAIAERAFAEVDRLEDIFSLYRPASALSRLNAEGALENPPFELLECLGLCGSVHRASGGAFDPCLGGEVMRRGFGPAGAGAGSEGRAHGPGVWRQLLPEPGRLYQPGGVTLDLNAVAKGYAVDQMGEVLAAFGVTQYLVEIGGEFAARGVKPDRSPWWVDLENPSPGAQTWRVALIGQAVATSGDYRQRIVRNCHVLSHIVPSVTRDCSLGDLASVTVIDASCARADAWATALFAMGDASGLALANRLGLPVLLQFRDAPARASEVLSVWLS